MTFPFRLSIQVTVKPLFRHLIAPVAALAALASSGCVTFPHSRGDAAPGGLRPTGQAFEGRASWYSVRTNGGRRTASGVPLSDSAPTAAHRSLPFGTPVRVTNLRNGRSAIVRITDRGPYIRGRIIDVSIGTARQLDFVGAGVVPVRVEVMAR
ncbi:MAG: septal ring lytic transglycosylase RlpA family protein [Verrucomicrobiae bacterium]|nr:septal ring lytic transglycosylase RlpA family protein [Verrucomicrobiae bacterium]